MIVIQASGSCEVLYTRGKFILSWLMGVSEMFRTHGFFQELFK